MSIVPELRTAPHPPPACGHFSPLERPGAIARLIQEDA